MKDFMLKVALLQKELKRQEEYVSFESSVPRNLKIDFFINNEKPKVEDQEVAVEISSIEEAKTIAEKIRSDNYELISSNFDENSPMYLRLSVLR